MTKQLCWRENTTKEPQKSEVFPARGIIGNDRGFNPVSDAGFRRSSQ